MPIIQLFSRDLLLTRHGLSTRQVNSLLEKKVSEESIEAKASDLAKVAELIRLGDLLNSHGIDFIPLKGPILSYRIYGDATVRKYCDLDLLVEPATVLRASDLLTGIGYEPVGYTLPESKMGQRIVLSHVHHILFSHQLHDLRVELHWRLFQTPPVRISKLAGLVAGNLSEIELSGRSFRVLNNELELLYLVMHGSIHNWRRLKWLLDVHEFLKIYEIDGVRFKALAEELRAGRMISLTNFVLAEYLPGGPTIPWVDEKNSFMKSFAVRKIGEISVSDRESLAMRVNRLRFSLHSVPGLMYKLRRVLSALVFYTYQAFCKNEHAIA